MKRNLVKKWSIELKVIRILQNELNSNNSNKVKNKLNRSTEDMTLDKSRPTKMTKSNEDIENYGEADGGTFIQVKSRRKKYKKEKDSEEENVSHSLNSTEDSIDEKPDVMDTDKGKSDEYMPYDDNTRQDNCKSNTAGNGCEDCQRNELEDLLENTEYYIKPALRDIGTFSYRVGDSIVDYSYRIDDRRIDQFIAGCFIHIKITTLYFDELGDLVFGKKDFLKFNQCMLSYFDFVNNYYLRFFDKTDPISIRRILNLNNPISQMICWIVVDNYSTKYDDLANRIINDFPTESRILEDRVVEGINLNIVQVMINKVVRFMTDITEL